MSRHSIELALSSEPLSEEREICSDVFVQPNSAASQVLSFAGIEFGYIDVTLTPAWHISEQRIGRFTNNAIGSGGQWYGKGTYFGLNDASSTGISFLKGQPHYEHTISICGNVLAVNDSAADRLKFELMMREIIHPSTSIHWLAENATVGGYDFDSFLMLSCREQESPVAGIGAVYTPEESITVLSVKDHL